MIFKKGGIARTATSDRLVSVGVRAILSMSTPTRYRNWRFLIYPESAPSNFLDLLSSISIPLALSPLHDHDFKSDGSPDKPHHHVLLTFSGVQSKEQVQAISNQFSGVLPIPCYDVRSSFRYLIHADNPEKYQYAFSDIKLFGGFSPPLNTLSEDLVLLKEISHFILDNNIIEASDLMQIAYSHFPQWEDVLLGHQCYAIYKLIDSNRHKKFSHYKYNGVGEDEA